MNKYDLYISIIWFWNIIITYLFFNDAKKVRALIDLHIKNSGIHINNIKKIEERFKILVEEIEKIKSGPLKA